MELEHIFTAIILGITGGIIPGPIIILAFSEVLRSPDKGLINGGKYLLFAGLSDFIIGLFLIATSSWLNIPPIVFHAIAIIGVIMLVYLSVQVYKIHKRY